MMIHGQERAFRLEHLPHALSLQPHHRHQCPRGQAIRTLQRISLNGRQAHRVTKRFDRVC